MHPKTIAFYLPQFHPIPENDSWWGKGFTEWTNVTKAKPLFKGHYQPRYPADLGYYDLRVPEIREQQAEMARFYGIDGFCYYHYWFDTNRTLLERPFNEVLKTGEPNFPFCLCWANQTWKGIWFGSINPGTLMEQKYSGRRGYIEHFNYLLTAFSDPRYILVEGKPLFLVHDTMDIPDLKEFTDTFQDCAKKAGFKGLYLVASHCPEKWDPQEHGFDSILGSEFSTLRYYTAPYHEKKDLLHRATRKLKTTLGLFPITDVEKRTKPIVVEYKTAIKYLISKEKVPYHYVPCVIPNWDNTARSGVKGLVFHNSTPELWEEHLLDAYKIVADQPNEKKMIFIKSWNEWAEGNYLEPDKKWGYTYLEVLKKVASTGYEIDVRETSKRTLC
jgi:hypothetical protein